MLEFIGTGFLRVPVSVLCHVKLIIFELHVGDQRNKYFKNKILYADFSKIIRFLEGKRQINY